MTTFRRYLVFQAFTLWQGGFLFYSAFVVPAGTHVLGGAAEQGVITRLVTNALNGCGAVALAVIAWDLAVARDPSARRTAARWWLWFGMLAAQYLLFVLHQALDFFMTPDGRAVVLRPYFRRFHQTYLWVHTVQWVAGLVFAWVTLRAWDAEAAISHSSGPSRRLDDSKT